MLCVADYLDALNWVESIGGQNATAQRCRDNLAVIESFVDKHDWISFLASDSASRSCTSVCLVLDLAPAGVKSMIGLLAEEEVAFDIGAYRDAPAGLRIWCGATVERSDLELLMPWLEWAYQQAKEQS
jgi:phosphoserine aminotransferase